MGCIPNKKRVASGVSTSANSQKSITDLKDSLVYHIFRLHQLVLSCRSAMETSLIKDEKHKALVIKQKELVIKEKLETLRNSIKKIDDFLDEGFQVKSTKKMIIEEGSSLLKVINSAEFLDDISEILDPKSNHWVVLKKELEKYGMNEKNIFILVEQEYQKIKSTENGTMIRRRYSHRSTAELIQ